MMRFEVVVEKSQHVEELLREVDKKMLNER